MTSAAGSDRPPRLARWVSVAALLAVGVLAVYTLFGAGDSGTTYHLLFRTGGQLVPGNEVLVAGQKIGSVDDVTLTDDAQAEVTVSVDEPLHEGTTATIRATSLSGIANRYVSIAPGPNSAPELADGATLTGEHTTTPVDLDQLFDTFRPQTRAALQDVIQGSAQVYAGAGEQANRTYRFLAPALGSTQRLFDEITRDQGALTRLLASGSSVLGAVAERRDDLSALTENANVALGAIASENEALDRSLAALPPTLEQGTTTFAELRRTLNALDPLVQTAIPATKDLAPFLADVRPVAERAIPVVKNLGKTVHLGGTSNDLTDALNQLPAAESKASAASPRIVDALDASQPVIEFIRPYSPDLFAWLTKFGESAAYYDANGHYLRAQPAGANLFRYNQGTGVLDPIPASQQYADYASLGQGPFTRCPGGSTQPIAGSNPFLDDGTLVGECDPLDVPPGP
jgi:phospholipid/cholesterol/gamma-HCH transport system substrate-binding protein